MKRLVFFVSLCLCGSLSFTTTPAAESDWAKIGPDGKLIAKNLDANSAVSLLARHLGGHSTGSARATVTCDLRP